MRNVPETLTNSTKMKTKYLLSYRWRPFGWILIVITLLAHFWQLTMGEKFSLDLLVRIPVPFEWAQAKLELWNGLTVEDKGVSVQLFHTILILTMICGLLMVGFSRLKIEDERTAQIRLESLQWGIYVNYFVLAVCTLVFYGLSYLSVIIYSMFTPLIIFVVRFYWLLYLKPVVEARREGRFA